MNPRSAWRCLGLVLLLAACGDPPSYDHRGYSKEPLERMGVFMHGEKRSDVARFRKLNLPDTQVVVLPDSTHKTT